MIVEIPDEIYKEFLEFMDLAQGAFTEDDVSRFDEAELAVLRLIEGLIGENRIRRCATIQEQRETPRDFLSHLVHGIFKD